jgi:uncharacterized protein (TIGR00255 family)
MLSMTGFGRAIAVVGDRRLTVEVRSVNHRGLDVKIRGRDVDAACEIEILKAVRAAVHRGSVVVSIQQEEGGAGVLTGIERARTLHAALERLREGLGIPGPVDLATVAAFLPIAGAAGPVVSAEEQWSALAPALAAALASLREARTREGAALAEDLHARLDALRRLVAGMGSEAEALPRRAAERLRARLATLLGDAEIDAARLAQEVAILAERLDVTEELTRLATHLSHLEALLRGGTAQGRRSEAGGAAGGDAGVGRRMDFVIQEIGRELNTVGSKVQDATVATLVIDAKGELEKIREQAQNIE